MVSKCSVENEGIIYLYASRGHAASCLAKTEIDGALRARRCGRVVGSGRSIADPGTYEVEVVSYDSVVAEDAIADTISRLGISDYEIVWD